MEEIEEIYQIQADDDYFKCCGEIFLTIKGHLILHCTLCEEKHLTFEKYCDHLTKYHHLLETTDDANDEEILEYKIQEDAARSDVIQVDLIEEEEEKPNKMNVEELNIEVIEEDEPLVCTTLKFQKDQLVMEIDKPNVRKKTNSESTLESPKIVENCKIQSNTREGKPTARKVMPISNELDPDRYHELPSCDRPKLNRSRKPASSLSSEERKHKCPYCPFASKDKTNLWSHIQRHSNNKPHQCSYCPKSFHTRVELTFHTRYHTGERPYQCSFTECGRNFVTKEHLKQHVKRHNNQRDFHCPDCNKGFFSSQEAREHMVVHTKETPFQCDQCDGVFTRKKALIAHKKLHANKRSYKCNLCDAAFNQAAALNLHMKAKHKAFDSEEIAVITIDTTSN